MTVDVLQFPQMLTMHPVYCRDSSSNLKMCLDFLRCSTLKKVIAFDMKPAAINTSTTSEKEEKHLYYLKNVEKVI